MRSIIIELFDGRTIFLKLRIFIFYYVQYSSNITVQSGIDVKQPETVPAVMLTLENENSGLCHLLETLIHRCCNSNITTVPGYCREVVMFFVFPLDIVLVIRCPNRTMADKDSLGSF